MAMGSVTVEARSKEGVVGWRDKLVTGDEVEGIVCTWDG